MVLLLISWLNIVLKSETLKIDLVYKVVAGFAGVLVSMRFVEQGAFKLEFDWVHRRELIIIANIDPLLGNLFDWLASLLLQILAHFTSLVACGIFSSTQCTLGWFI
jgi:hypothetical protein